MIIEDNLRFLKSATFDIDIVVIDSFHYIFSMVENIKKA